MPVENWKRMKRRRKPEPLPGLDSGDPLTLMPEEIRSGASLRCGFAQDGIPAYYIEANTVRGLRQFSNFGELTDQYPRVKYELFTEPSFGAARWGQASSPQVVFTLSRPCQTEPTEDVPSASDVLIALTSSDLSAARQRQMILAAEVLRFDAGQLDVLKPVLRHYADRYCLSEQPEEQVAVASALRKYVASLSVRELPAVADLLKADRKAPPWFELEVAKMITRKLIATLPEDAVPLERLGDELMDLVRGYFNPRMLPKKHCGAVALDSALASALLAGRHLPELLNHVRSVRVGWFQATVSRQARAVRASLGQRFPADRCARSSEALGELAAAAKQPRP